MKTYVFYAIGAFLILASVPSMASAYWEEWQGWGGSTGEGRCGQNRDFSLRSK